MVTKKGKDTSSGLAVSAGLAAAAAVAAAGAYWFYGSEDAQKHRRQAKSWMLKARAEVMEAVEKMEDIDKQKYLTLVQQIMSRYSKMSGVTSAELVNMTRDLKNTWIHMEKAKKPVKKAITKAKRKASKKK